MKARISRKFFCLLLAVVMVCTLLPISALAAEPSGSIESAGITQNAVSVELQNVTFNESVAVKLYSGDKLLTTATLNTEKDVTAGTHDYLTCCIGTEEADEYWPLTPWTPRADVVPDKAVLFVDSKEMASKVFKLDAEAWADLPGIAPPSSGSIMRAYLNTDRITVDMANVTFYESVALELYSGEIKLTTSTLNTELVPARTYGELTGMIGLTANDEYWTYTAWTPKKDVVPDTVKLLVDGVEKDTAQLVVVFNGEETKPMHAEDWKALDATIYTASGSIESVVITRENGVLKNAVSVELQDVAFNKSVVVKLYSGKKLLTTATLNTDKLGAGSYPFVTCCIPTEGEDDAWSLTPWTPKDDVVPDKAVLFVDGHKLDEKTFKLNADEWAALPGTIEVKHTPDIYLFVQPVDSRGVKLVGTDTSIKQYVGRELNADTLTRAGFTASKYGGYNHSNKEWITVGKMTTALPLPTYPQVKDITDTWLDDVTGELKPDTYTPHADAAGFRANISQAIWTKLQYLTDNYSHYGYAGKCEGYHLDGLLTFYYTAFKDGLPNDSTETVGNMPKNNYPEKQIYDYYIFNNRFTLPDNIPTREGYTFLGWKAQEINNDGAVAYANRGSELYQPGQTYDGIRKDVVFTAQWEAKKANVHIMIFKSNDLVNPIVNTKYTTDAVYGDTLDLTALDPKTYLKFDFEIDGGWYDDGRFNRYKKYVNGEQENKPAELTGLQINGNWQNLKLIVTELVPVVYFDSLESLTAYQNDHSKREGILHTTKARVGSALPTADAPIATREGYTFTFWSREGQTGDVTGQTVNGWTNLYANWEKKTYKVVAKLYVNGKPAYDQNEDFYTYEASGLYGEDIDFDTIKAKAVEQAKQIKKASASYTAVILEDHEPNPVCTTYGEHQPGQATHYVKVNVKTEENVVIFQSFEGKTDLTKLRTTTAPYGTNVVGFLNGLGLDLDVAGYTLDTAEDNNTNWYKKDSPKWTFGTNDTINGWTNVLLKYTITPHNIYAYLRTSDSIGDVLELNEATLNRLGLTKYNTKGFISIGKFVSNTLLTQDEYYGFDEDKAFLDVLAELQTKLVPETDVSLDKVGSKINWSWLYQVADVDDRIAGYPTEDEDGYQLSGTLLFYGAKFVAGADDVTGMPQTAYGTYYDYYVDGESFNLPAAPTRPGYDFKGWKIGNAVLTAGAAYTVDEDDMVFTAQWEARTDTPYKVEHYLEKLDGSYTLDTTEDLKGTTDTTATATPKTDYANFTYDSAVSGTVASGNIAGDGSLVLKLFYTRNTYDYTVRHIKQLPDGTYDEANAEVEKLSGKFEALAAVTAKNYGSHYPTNDAGTKQNIKIEKNLTIDVKYDLDNHTLTFETNGGSTIAPVTVRHGNAVARPADPTKDKYTFIGWYVDPEFSAEYDFATVLEADKTIYAKFELTATPIGDIYVRYDVLHIKQLPDGSYDLANAEVEHLSAKKDTTVTAVVKDYSASHHVTVNTDKSLLTDTAIQPHAGADGKPVYTILKVYYDLDYHTLTFDTMGGSTIAPVTVRHGLTVAKPTDPTRFGYWFGGWYTSTNYTTEYDFATPLTADITIYAKWSMVVLPNLINKKAPKLNTSDHFAYVQGYPNGTVKPAGNITRAETAAILFRLMDDTSRNNYYSTKSGFRDVAAGSWYNTYVATLNNAGVITDSSNGYFRPNEAITRAELAAMLAAFTDTTHAANYFNDVTANYWAANAIAVCAKLGWITGYPDGSFRPDRNVTRAELMAMINRATGRAPKSADAFLPGMKTWSDNTADKWYYLDVQEATNSHSYTVRPTEIWTAITAAPNWSKYE